MGGEDGQIAGLDEKLREEVAHRATEAGVDEIRRDVAHRHHHEPALVHPRVWDLERQRRRAQLIDLGVPVLAWDGVSPLGALLGRAAAGPGSGALVGRGRA